MGQNDVLRIRRSRWKVALPTAIALGMGAGCLVWLVPTNIGGEIIGIAGAVVFFSVGLRLFRELLVPRDVMLIGPEGIDQRAVHPHVLIPWGEIAHIGVIERSNRVMTLGITVRHPAQFFKRGALRPVRQSRWLPWFVKLLLGTSQLLYEGPAGVTDAVDTFREDMSAHATFEISTLAFPLSTEELVQLLRVRWRKAVGPPRHPHRHRHR